MSSTYSSVVALSSFNLLFFTQVLTVLSSTIKYSEYATDKGGNVSIPCTAPGSVMWIRENNGNSTIIQMGRVLLLRNVSTSDGGIYVCFAAIQQPVSLSTTTVTTITTAVPLDNNDNNDNNNTNNIDIDIDNDNVNVNDDDPEEKKNKKGKIDHELELEYQAYQPIRLTVRTVPGPVTQLYFKASTILGFLIWRFNKTQSGGYPVRSFTAEYRNISYETPPSNASYEHAWNRMDPINIAPNVRQMEVYRLAPNTTYEFRIWANNELGSGEIVTTNVTTLPETKEEDLIRLIKPDLDNFDPRIWIVAVSIVLGTLVILAIGLCIVLSKECYQSSQMEHQDGWDSIELIPNIILNPGFSESDGVKNVQPTFPRTIIFGVNGNVACNGNDDNNPHIGGGSGGARGARGGGGGHNHHILNDGNDDDDDDDEDYEEEQEPTMEKFKRKVSVFFTGPTIKRI